MRSKLILSLVLCMGCLSQLPAYAQEDAVKCKYFSDGLKQYATDLEQTTNYANDIARLFFEYCVYSPATVDKKICGGDTGIAARQFYEAVSLRQLFFEHHEKYSAFVNQFCPTGTLENIIGKTPVQ